MTHTDSKTFREDIARFHATLGAQRFALGIGTAYIGQGADEGKRTLFQQTLDDAYTAGIRYYDTSAQYGGSEYRVGEFLRRIDRTGVFVATKSPIPAALTAKEAALHVRQGLRNSLERLGVAQNRPVSDP